MPRRNHRNTLIEQSAVPKLLPQLTLYFYALQAQRTLRYHQGLDK